MDSYCLSFKDDGKTAGTTLDSFFMQHHNFIFDVKDQLFRFAAAECPSHRNRKFQEEKFQSLMVNATANRTHAIVGQHQFNTDEGDCVPFLGHGRFRKRLLFGGLNTKTACERKYFKTFAVVRLECAELLVSERGPLFFGVRRNRSHFVLTSRFSCTRISEC